MWVYITRFQLHMHIWLLNGIAYCLIHLTIVNREDNAIEDSHAKILISALEQQVSLDDTYG